MKEKWSGGVRQRGTASSLLALAEAEIWLSGAVNFTALLEEVDGDADDFAFVGVDFRQNDGFVDLEWMPAFREGGDLLEGSAEGRWVALEMVSARRPGGRCFRCRACG